MRFKNGIWLESRLLSEAQNSGNIMLRFRFVQYENLFCTFHC